MARILIIDDEERVRKTLRQMLEQGGHEVVEAADGRQAVTLYREDPVDLVITDLIMPEKQGIQAATELRNYDPEVKIIAMSGSWRIGDMEVREILQKFGIRHALPKPIRLKRLLTTVRNVIEH